MENLPIVISYQRQRVRMWRLSLAVIFSIAILAAVWFFPQLARWGVNTGDGYDQLLGFTDRGEVLTVHNESRAPGTPRSLRSTCSVREMLSGKERQRFKIPPEYDVTPTLLPDGKTLVLRSHPKGPALKLASWNLNDGSTTHQLDGYTLSEFQCFSPNGRYWTVTDTEGDNFVYDSVLKKISFPTRKPLFCSDNQRLIMEDSSGDQVAFQFYSLSTGQLLGRVELHYPWQTILKFRSWEGDRIEFWIEDQDASRKTLYSCDVSNYQLSDLQREPDWKGAVISNATGVTEYLRGAHWAGVWTGVWRDMHTKHYFHSMWDRTVVNLGLKSYMLRPPRPVFTWQSLNPETGEPICRPISIASYTGCRLSPDGRLLFAYDGNLKCWDVDPPSRFPLVITALVGIWIMLWKSRWLIWPPEMA